MNDKEKFIAEWKVKFPQEEPPDASLISSVNFMNIRSKISDSESRIKDLKLALKKEQFLLNWLIELEIEISVLGNVGFVSDNSVTLSDTTPIWNEGVTSPDDQKSFVEETRNINPVDPVEEVLATHNEPEIADTHEKDEQQPAIAENGPQEEKEIRPVSPKETVTVNEDSEKLNEHLDADDCSNANEGSFHENRQLNIPLKAQDLNSYSEEADDHEYVNVFDLLGEHTTEVESPTRKGKDKDKRRAGGSWSLYMDEKESTKRNDVEVKEETIYDEIKPVIDDENKTNSEDLPSIKRSGDSRSANVYEEIELPIEDSVDNFEKKSSANDDNVTINLLYEAPTISLAKNQPANVELDEKEDDEAIYVNVRDFSISGRIAPVARIEASDTSDYDSDSGRQEKDDRTHNYRHMTVDEINSLRKWRSDEDLSQFSQDFDDRSCDSDDSLGTGSRGRSSSQRSQGNKLQNDEESVEGNFEADRNKGPNDDDAQDDARSESPVDQEEGEGRSKSLKMRTYLVKNLLESENCYFDCIDMIKKYMKPLQKSTETSQPILTMLDFNKIFLGIEDLHSVHLDLLQQLEQKIDNWGPNQTIGDLLTILMDGFSVYKAYINNYKSSQETLLKCRNANSVFDGIVQKEIKIQSLKDPIKLDALLYKPVDRMTQYSLILNDLLKYTPEDHPDHALVSEATANLFDLFEQVNVNRNDKKAPQRQLLKEGNVVELDDGQRKARTLFLMSDVIICAKLKPSKDAYVCKWYISLSDIQLKPFKESEGSQTVPVTTKADCDRLRATIANIRSEMRRDVMVSTPQSSFEGGSPFARPKIRKRDSTATIPGPRASTRAIEKLKKKLQEQERLLQLIAPSIPLNIYHRSGKTYTLLLGSDNDRMLWKEAIAPRIKRMLSRKQGTIHLSNVEIQQALETSLRVQRLGMRFGAAITSPFFPSLRQDSEEPDNEDGLTGYLYIHVQNGKSFSRTAENYCILDVDSYGHFFRKGKTKAAKGAEPQWDEDFEFDVEAASLLRITCYNNRGRLLGDEISGKVVIDLGKENLADNRCHTFTVILDKQGAITLTISYSQSRQGIKRTRTNASESKVFKVPISTVTRREKFDIPLIVISCIKEIEKRGLDEIGIYRLSGIASEVKSLKTVFDENPQSAALNLAEADINAVAGLVKLYLRELPEPLFTNALYPRFVSGLQISDKEEKELYMIDTFQQLPKPNKLTALYLFEHLRRVSQKESTNKMGINNLSTVFGPTVLRPSVPEADKNHDNLRSGSTFDIGALDVMSQVSVFRFFLGLNSNKTRLPEDDLELWQRLDYQKAAEIQEKLMENAVEYLI
ncbi:active breakpoint cluster region-related protein-like [Rhopilema esculentum]|uniref:active breakpoint cluster region-related protein-like n=1 Tax=Rhopilema esculentum TaxID=499914 RepID=UPI0031DFE8DA